MFHASTDEASKERILENITSPDGHLKLLISTIAFGMGVNIPDVDLVIHWGIPPSALSYWQEIGRCARDGRDGFALCYAFQRSISKCESDSIKSLFKEDPSKCIRKEVLKTFQLKGLLPAKSSTTKKTHDNCGEQSSCHCAKCNCCSVCLQSCSCSNKVSNRLLKFLSQ
jgi:superfamily II DNA helicase RecQ